jgi:low affinity Fe/Cu permease
MELLDAICKYWQVIVALFGIVYTFMTLKIQNSEQERRICVLEKKIDEMNPVLIDIRTKLASIEATLKMLTRDK